MARIKFTRAGRARPRDKGGQRWLHEKAYRYKDKADNWRLRPPVYLEHEKTYGEDVVSAQHMSLLCKRHPEIFSLIEDPKPAPKKVESKPAPTPEPEPVPKETESSTEEEA